MIELLIKSGHTQTISKSIYNNLLNNSCIWDENECLIWSNKFITKIDYCFKKSSVYTIRIEQCKEELYYYYYNNKLLQNVINNSTRVDHSSVVPAQICYVNELFSLQQPACSLVNIDLQYVSNWYRQYSRGSQQDQLLQNLRYISISNLMQQFEKYLDIKNGDIELQNAFVVPLIALGAFLCCIGCGVRNLQDITRHTRRIQQNVQLTNATIQRGRHKGTIDAQIKEIMDGLRNLKYKAPKEQESIESICCICLEIFKESEVSTVLPCYHWFHKKCLEEWIKSKGENVACPLCNNKLRNYLQQQAQ